MFSSVCSKKRKYIFFVCNIPHRSLKQFFGNSLENMIWQQVYPYMQCSKFHIFWWTEEENLFSPVCFKYHKKMVFHFHNKTKHLRQILWLFFLLNLNWKDKKNKTCLYFSHSQHQIRQLSCKIINTKSLKLNPEAFINRGKCSGRFWRWYVTSKFIKV